MILYGSQTASDPTGRYHWGPLFGRKVGQPQTPNRPERGRKIPSGDGRRRRPPANDSYPDCRTATPGVAQSREAKLKEDTKRTGDGYPVQSFRTLLDDLSTLTLNSNLLSGTTDITFETAAKSMPVQAKALELLGVDATAPRFKSPSGGAAERRM